VVIKINVSRKQLTCLNILETGSRPLEILWYSLYILERSSTFNSKVNRIDKALMI